MPKNWPGRKCNRSCDERCRPVQTGECNGDEGNPCLSCQLKNLWNSKQFNIADYVFRIKKRGPAIRNLMLIKNPNEVPTYKVASWIIKIAVCDYLDEFESLHLVEPPLDYIRNPACVQRDEESRKATQQRIACRYVDITYRLKEAMSQQCWMRFGCSKSDTRYDRFQPDWEQYRVYCMNRWSDDNVSQAEIDAEATRLIELALEKDPTIACLPVVATVLPVDDDTSDEDWDDFYEQYPHLFKSKCEKLDQ